MNKFIQRLKLGISEVIFPTICAVCGLKLSSSEQNVCSFCLSEKFERAGISGRTSSTDLMLPEGILLQLALWNFDKGGYLQDLLHQLKYGRITGIGEDLGRQLGKSMQKNQILMEKISTDDVVLLPVPLHPQKKRTRGYNQAYFIAKGVKEVLDLPITSEDAVQRIKNTSTQTGFSIEKRRLNIDGAFIVNDPLQIEKKTCIIVDDVFTTGATTFELANVLQENGSGEIIIATVAQA